MLDEQGGKDYESVDMTVFFWCGVAFLLSYRVVVALSLCVFLVVMDGAINEADADDDDKVWMWYDPILMVFDVYVFKTVYLSLSGAQAAIQQNIEIRKKKKTASVSTAAVTASNATQIQGNIEVADPDTETGSTPQPNMKPASKVKKLKIEVHFMQKTIQFAESITESMPQIMLQSVFVIRSYNEEQLRDSEIWLILVSIFASLMSISSKYMWEYPSIRDPDQDVSTETMRYIVCVLWRTCDITSNFVVYVLIWTVMGGGWLPIWCLIIFIINVALFRVVGYFDMRGGLFIGTVMAFISLGGTLLKSHPKAHCLKWMQIVIGLALVMLFALFPFDCEICADSAHRQFDNTDESGVTNYRIFIFYVVGWIALVLEIVLYWVMKRNILPETTSSGQAVPAHLQVRSM